MKKNKFFLSSEVEEKSVLEHVGDLRKKLIISLTSIILGAITAHFFHTEIINFLLKPTNGQKLIFLSPLEPLFFIVKIDLIAGFIFSLPIIVWSILSYISPALPKKVYKLLFLLYIASVTLTVIGLLYAFFVIIPISLKFLFSINIPGIQNQISAQSYIDFFITQTLIIATIFQIPIIIISGIYINAFKTKHLRNKRKYIYLISIIFLAIITPTTDIFSLTIILLPFLFIFEISLILGNIIEFLKRKKI